MQVNKINILLVVRWPVGGIRTYMRYVFNNLDPDKYTFTLLAPDESEIPILLQDLNKHKINYIAMEKNPSVSTIIKDIISIFVKEQHDIIYSHGLTSGLCSILPSLVFRVPHLLTIHDVFTEKQFIGWKGCLKKYVISFLMPLITKIHTVSNDAKDNLLEYIPLLSRNKSNIIAIINGIETNRFDQMERRDLKMELQLESNSFLIGFFGRFMAQKGFIYLVEAIDQLYRKNDLNIKPVVMAFGEGAFIREEKSNIERKGLQEVIRFMPFVPNIAPVLKGVDLVVMPSLWEACGLLAMETMVAGIPLIGSDCIGLREVLAGTPCKTVPIKNSEALAEAISAEMSHPSKKEAELFVPEAMNRFDVKKHSREIEHLIKSIIKD